MVDGSDEISGVLRQINIKVPGALQQLRLAVGQVGAQHSLDDAVIVGFVELIQTGSEQRESGAGKDVLGTAHLQLIADVQHGLAGSDNIIGNEDVLTLDILAQVFMGNNGVAAIHNAAVITALVEHTQVAAQHAGVVHVAVHGAFIRGNDQELLLAEVDIRYMVQQALEHLIGGHNVIEAHQGHSVHYAGVMSIKGNNVLNAHGAQLLQSVSAVQAFAADAAMLAAAVQTGHDHADTVRTAGNSLDQADQVLEMVIRGKMVFVTKQVVGHAVVARIDKNVDIIATSGSLDKALSITGLETRAVRRNDESVHIHSHFTRPTHQMAVYQVAKLLCTRASQQCQISDRGFFAEKVAGAHRLFCHNISSFIDFHCAFVCAYCGGFCRTSKHILTHTHRKNSPYFLFLLCFRHFPRFAHSSTFFYQKILYDFTIS